MVPSNASWEADASSFTWDPVTTGDGACRFATGGVVRSTFHVRVAPVASPELPSTAYTENLCDPAASPLYAVGEVHEDSAAPSRLQTKVAVVSFEVNEN